MLEDMLAYEPRNLLNSFAELLAADLDDDTRHFYARMAADITTVAVGAGRAWRSAGVVQALLEALAATPAARAGCWRRLYRHVSGLVADCAQSGAAGDDDPALGRLRRFLRENVDLEDPYALRGFERVALGSSAGA
jgi:hypothetical protein